MNLHHWDTGAKYKDGDVAIVNGIEARVTYQPRGGTRLGCRACPAYNPCKQAPLMASDCGVSLGGSVYWMSMDKFLQLRLKGEL
jgi:hypothetical protein